MKLCEICHGGCCRRYNPDLTGFDIIKIYETLNLDIFFFLTVVPVDKNNLDNVLGKIPLFIFTDIDSKTYVRLALKSVESKYFQGTSKCMFLQEWDAQEMNSEELSGIIGRCGIYSARPLNCRAYPVKYDEEKEQVIVKDPYLVLEKEQKRTLDSLAYNLCPKPLTVDDYKPFMDDYIHNAMLNKFEKEFFLKVSQKWNENPDISDKFYTFLKQEYANRIEHIKE